MLFAAVAAMATVITLAMPLLAGDNLQKRMKSVAIERDKIRQRERERLARGDKVTLRTSPKQYMKTVVERFNLNKWVGQEEARDMLIQAGYRGQAPYVAFLFFRLVTPLVALVIALFYAFFLDAEQPGTIKILMCLAAAYGGMQAPKLFLKNMIQQRQLSINRAFPDALDLLLICVESGMSIEAAFRRVSQEIGSQSIAAGRRADPDDRRAVLPAGPQDGLREPRHSAPTSRASSRSAWRCSSPSATARRSGRRCA